MSEYKFVSHMIEGAEGIVRGLFANRQMKGSIASRMFPGVANVAILPKAFDDEQSAIDYLQSLMEKGGNAAAVKISDTQWLVCAWVAESA